MDDCRRKYTKSELTLIIITCIVVPVSIILALGLAVVVPKKTLNVTTEHKNEGSTYDISPSNNVPLTTSTLPSRRKKISGINRKAADPLDCLCPTSLDCPAAPIDQFPYLVSITAEPDLHICTGAIQSKSIVLTGQCVSNESAWKDLVVRAGSDYWSTGGTEHKIVSKFEDQGIVRLRVKPEFTFSDTIQPVVISEKNDNWVSGKVIGWVSATYGLKMFDIKNEGVNCSEVDEKVPFKCIDRCIGYLFVVNGKLVSLKSDDRCFSAKISDVDLCRFVGLI